MCRVLINSSSSRVRCRAGIVGCEGCSSGTTTRVFFRVLKARKHPKKFPCYKRYKNSRFFLDEKAKCQPWIIKKKPKLDENRIKIGENFILHP
jgi:hypothetical protein